MTTIFKPEYRHGLYFYAALKLFIVSLFIYSLGHVSNVSAGEKFVCAGTDIIAQLEKNEPEVLSRLQEKAAQAQFGSSRLWKISKAGIPDSWVFGTMHLSAKKVVSLPDAARAGFENSQTVLVEITDVADRKRLVATVMKLKHLIYRQDGKTIEDDISASHMAKVSAAIKARAMPYQVAIRMQPWMLAPAITAQLCEIEAKKFGKLFLDAKIMKMALEDDKQLVALETMEEQLEVLADMPREFHIASLEESLELGERLNDLKQSMKRLYLNGQIGMIVPLIRHISNKFANTTQYAEFLSKLLEERNVRMIERAAGYFEKGNVFMAVGALHLPGEQGVAALLEDQGYTITAVDAKAVTD